MQNTRPPRRIILLSDGTGNSAAKLFRTNVWRLYQALQLSNSEQIAMYDDGVGTSDFKPLAMLGGALGWGLKRNLLDLYTFLCRNYHPGDEIFLFGFSRGAFTVRVLAKFILSQGIANDFYSDDDLRGQARRLYRDFRRSRKTRFGLANVGRALRDAAVWALAKLFGRDQSAVLVTKPAEVEIEFIGVWDTVDAYGIPIYELKMGIDRYIWPLELEDKELEPRVKKACHAIGLDDKRKTFHPLIWNEEHQGTFPRSDSTDTETLTQVFFVGAHSNIGGGYPDDSLSYTSLNWMMKEASKKGLQFEKNAIEQIKGLVAPFGKLYNSRSGLGSYYRYEPRNIRHPRDNQSSRIIFPKIHETVLLRMAIGTDSYGPLELPENSRVVIESDWSAIQDKTLPSKNILTFSEFALRRDRFSQSYGGIALTAEAVEAIKFMEAPEHQALELIRDTVWWRRIAYFSTMFAGLFLFISPKYSLFNAYPVPAYMAAAFGLLISYSTYETLIPPIANFLADSITSVVPGFLAPWIKVFRAEPFNFLCLVGLLVACLLWGALIDRRINDRSTAIWNKAWSDRRLRWFNNSLKWRSKSALAVATVGILLFMWLGYQIKYGSRECQSLDCFGKAHEYIAQVLVAGFLIVTTAVASIGYVANLRIANSSRRLSTEPRGVLLTIANRLRTSTILLSAFKFTSTNVVPAGFAFMVVFGAISALNKALFKIFDVTGQICVPSPRLQKEQEAKEKPVVALHFDSGCQATGIFLIGGRNYTVRLQEDLDEFDAETSRSSEVIEQSDMSPDEKLAQKNTISIERAAEREKLSQELAGLPKNSELPNSNRVVNTILTPTLRAPTAGRYAPLLKIGNTANNEMVIEDARIVVPDSSGYAYLYLNSPIIGWPSIYDVFYTSKGSMLVRIERTEDDDK